MSWLGLRDRRICIFFFEDVLDFKLNVSQFVCQDRVWSGVRPLRRISLDCRMCVNELLCLYRAFCHFFFFWFATLYGFYYFWWKKHIKKQYKSTHACFSLCHRKLYTRKKTALNEFDLRGENKKRLRWCYRTDLYLTKTQFGSFFHQSRLIFLLTTTEKLWGGRTWTLLHVEKKTENICFGEI